ncbi:MAG: alpha/beta hydrolase [Elusimicrobiaceae bacterium]
MSFRIRLVLATVLTAVIAGSVYVGLKNFVFHATYLPVREMQGTPASYNLKYEDVSLGTKDGRLVTGWYIPAEKSSAPAVLYCHGNANNISVYYQLYKAGLLHKMGFNVLTFDYGGYGNSRGSLSEEGTYKDATAAYYYLVFKKNIPPERIVIYGHSLGTAVAAYLAANLNASALILEAPFTSLADMGRILHPWLPSRLLVGRRYDTASRIAGVNMPLLILHSAQDEIIPYSMGRKLYETAKEPKDFIKLKGDHCTGFKDSGDVYVVGLKNFFLKRINYNADKLLYIVEPKPFTVAVQDDRAVFHRSAVKTGK